ncbi:hypothetical protein D3C76_1799860 [compost metagenome]
MQRHGAHIHVDHAHRIALQQRSGQAYADKAQAQRADERGNAQPDLEQSVDQSHQRTDHYGDR